MRLLMVMALKHMLVIQQIDVTLALTFYLSLSIASE
jgi:hypothetical protein